MKLSLKKITARIPKRLRTKKAVFVAIAVLIAMNILTRGAKDTKQIRLASAQVKTISSTVSASGIVKSESESILKFASSGKIAWISIKEGDKISAGNAIATLDKTKLEADLRISQQEVNETDAILSQIYDEQKKQKAAENFDQKIKRTTAESNKNQAYDALKKAEENLQNATIYAPFSGTITKLDAVIGDEVTQTTEIGEIADLENIVFTGEVNETDIGKVKAGQKSTISLDAFPDEQIESKVKSLGSKAITTSAGATAFEVKFELKNDKDYLLGMNGEADITTSQKNNILTIPLEALADDNHVWVLENGKYLQKEIKTGIESDVEAEVLENLNENDQVVTSGFSELAKKSLLEKILRR